MENGYNNIETATGLLQRGAVKTTVKVEFYSVEANVTVGAVRSDVILKRRRGRGVNDVTHSTSEVAVPAVSNPASSMKPLLRGWLHAGAAVAALLYTVAACWRSWGDLPRFFSLLIFGLGMIELYTMSAIYHRGRWSARTHRVLRAIDHSNIFVLIAATYTPLCFNLLTGAERWVLLGLIWVLAVAGVIASTVTRHIPRWINTVLYIGMGWLALLAFPGFLQVLPLAAVGVLVLGGVLYTVGAVVYALKRPNPFPRVLGFHEIFHLFTIAAAVAFASVIWVWAVPPAGG